MTDATKLLLVVVAVIPDSEKVAAFFAEDGVVETVGQKLFRRRQTQQTRTATWPLRIAQKHYRRGKPVHAGVRSVASYQVVTQTDTFALGSLPVRPAFPVLLFPSCFFLSCSRPVLANLRNPRLFATFGIGFCLLFTLVATFSYITFYLSTSPFDLSTKPRVSSWRTRARTAFCVMRPPRVAECRPTVCTSVATTLAEQWAAFCRGCSGSTAAGRDVWPWSS
jgi:hypothetical protein